jgi:isoleucyl-tRNA synthetase
VTYANIDGWSPSSDLKAAFSELDLWILARLNELIEIVTAKLEAFEPNSATAAINDFIDDLSNWYLRRSRRRFWAKSGTSDASDADKDAAYRTLYTVLENLIKILAPFVPFVTEEIYQNLVRTNNPDAVQSVHHCEWPRVDESFVNERLIREGSLIKRLVSLGHAARNQANRKLRQPLSEAAFHLRSQEEVGLVERNIGILAAELNVKHVRFLDTVSEAVRYSLNPLPKQLGQKYGSMFPMIREQIQGFSDAELETVATRLIEGESITVTVGDQDLLIHPDEVEIKVEAHEGLSAAADGPYMVALNTTLTPELEREGLAREFVRRVQDLRKQAGLQVDDRITLAYQAEEPIRTAVSEYEDYIKEETLAVSMDEIEIPAQGSQREYQLDGKQFRIGIRKA